MMLLKSCPRCGGDLTVDLNGEISCLQCGYELRPQDRAVLAQRLQAQRRARSTARAAA